MNRITAISPRGVLVTLSQFRWLRGHISVFLAGVSVLVSLDLLIGGGTRWSLTLTGVWSMILFVHSIVLLIARLALQLEPDAAATPRPFEWPLARRATPESTWEQPPMPAEIDATWRQAAEASAAEEETVSWQVATDIAQGRIGEMTAATSGSDGQDTDA